MINQEKNIKIAVIGDSHTRAFGFTNIFIPVFLGSGKQHCFIDDKRSEIVLERLTKSIQNIKQKSGIKTYLLVFGEPDTRWLLGKGWYPWNKKIYNPFIYLRRWNLLEKIVLGI